MKELHHLPSPSLHLAHIWTHAPTTLKTAWTNEDVPALGLIASPGEAVAEAAHKTLLSLF